MSQPTHIKKRRRQSAAFEQAKRLPEWCVRLRNQPRFTAGIDHAKTVTLRLDMTYADAQLFTLARRAESPLLFFSAEKLWE